MSKTIFPEWYDLSFIKEHPYPLVRVNGNYFDLLIPNGKITFDVSQNVVSIEGKIPDDMKDIKVDSRQFDMFQKIPTKFLVIGAGGVGAWVAITLLKAAPYSKIVVFDNDDIEDSNLERLPYPKSFVGINKAIALASWCKSVIEKEIAGIPYHFEVELFDDGLVFTPDVVIECSDNYDIQKDVYKYCRKNRIRFFKVGTFRNTVMISRTVGGWETGFELEGTCGNGIPQWQATQMLAAAQVCSYILRGEFIGTQLCEGEIPEKSLFDKKYQSIAEQVRIQEAIRATHSLSERLELIGLEKQLLDTVASKLKILLNEVENENEQEQALEETTASDSVA